MVYKQKSSRYWWFKFHFDGVLIRESAKTTNKRIAEQIESARQTQLAKGEVGIRDKKPVPTFAEFVKRDFLPHVEANFAHKRSTLAYYRVQLSHLDFGTTRRYVHPNLNTAREALERARVAQGRHKIGHSVENGFSGEPAAIRAVA